MRIFPLGLISGTEVISSEIEINIKFFKKGISTLFNGKSSSIRAAFIPSSAA